MFGTVIVVVEEYPPVRGGIARYVSDIVHFLSRAADAIHVVFWGNAPVGSEANYGNIEFHDMRGSGEPERSQILVSLARRTRASTVLFTQVHLMGARTVLRLREMGLKTGVFVHGADIGVVRGMERIRTYARLLAVGNVITQSTSTQRLLRHRYPGIQARIIYPGINTSSLHAVAAGNRRRVVSVGRLIERKGHDVLLKAMHRIHELRGEGELVIIGTGPRLQYLREAARDLGIEESVLFRGEVDDSEVWSELTGARVFSLLPRQLPSGDIEGFGIVFLEAASVGLPSVAGNSGGVSEAVRHELSGFLVDPTDVSAVADRILCLLEDDKLWHRMSRGAREWGLRFDWGRRNPEQEFGFLLSGTRRREGVWR